MSHFLAGRKQFRCRLKSSPSTGRMKGKLIAKEIYKRRSGMHQELTRRKDQQDMQRVVVTMASFSSPERSRAKQGPRESAFVRISH